MSKPWYFQSDPVGGDGGQPFSFLNDPIPVTRITVWSDTHAIRAMRFLLANKTEPGMGTLSGNSQSISFGPGEVITKLSMMKTEQITPSEPNCVGQISITTNKGQQVKMGPGGTWSYDIQVGSGILVGWAGLCASAIDSLSLYFLQPVKFVNVVVRPDDAWNSLLGTSVQPGQTQLVSQPFSCPPYGHNNPDPPLNFTWDASKPVTNTTFFQQPATTFYSDPVIVGVAAGLFDIVQVGNGFQWARGPMGVQRGERADTQVTMGSTVSGQAMPGYTVFVTTTSQLGELNFEYTSDVQLVFQDSSIAPKSYVEIGIFAYYKYASGQSGCGAPVRTG